jgi:hypothetical protein
MPCRRSRAAPIPPGRAGGCCHSSGKAHQPALPTDARLRAVAIGTGKTVNIFTIPTDQLDSFNRNLYQLSDEDRTSRWEEFLKAADEMPYAIEYCSVSHYTCTLVGRERAPCIGA